MLGRARPSGYMRQDRGHYGDSAAADRLVLQPGVNAVLDLLVSRRVSHVIDVRQVGDELLADRLRTEVGGDEMQLRHVRPNGFARVGAAEQQVRRDVTRPIPRAGVGGHGVQLGRSLRGDGI